MLESIQYAFPEHNEQEQIAKESRTPARPRDENEKSHANVNNNRKAVNCTLAMPSVTFIECVLCRHTLSIIAHNVMFK